MFDEQGNYVGAPDHPTRFVLVATQDHTNIIGRNAVGPYPFKSGTVMEVIVMGHTNVASAKQYPKGEGVWIEHATADVGDVIPSAELSAAVAAATKKQAAVRAYQEQERIDGPARAAKAAAEKATADEAAMLARIDARIKMHLAKAE